MVDRRQRGAAGDRCPRYVLCRSRRRVPSQRADRGAVSGASVALPGIDYGSDRGAAADRRDRADDAEPKPALRRQRPYPRCADRHLQRPDVARGGPGNPRQFSGGRGARLGGGCRVPVDADRGQSGRPGAQRDRHASRGRQSRGDGGGGVRRRVGGADGALAIRVRPPGLSRGNTQRQLRDRSCGRPRAG